MSAPDRRPMAPMQSREPHSIRFTPTEWEQIGVESTARGLEPAVFVRKLTLIALDDLTRYSRREDALGIPAIGGRGSQRTGRF